MRAVFQVVEEAFDEAAVVGDDFGSALDFVLEVEGLPVVGGQALGQFDGDEVGGDVRTRHFFVFGDEGDGGHAPVNCAVFQVGVVVQFDDDRAVGFYFSRTCSGQQHLPEDGVAGGHDAEHFFPGLEVLVFAEELEEFHLPVHGGFEYIFFFPRLDVVQEVAVCGEEVQVHVALVFGFLRSQEVEAALGFGNLGVEGGQGAVELAVFGVGVQAGRAHVVVFFFGNHVFAVKPVLAFEPFVEHVELGKGGGGVCGGLLQEEALPMDVFFEAFDLLLVGVVFLIVAQGFDGGEEGEVFQVQFAKGQFFRQGVRPLRDGGIGVETAKEAGDTAHVGSVGGILQDGEVIAFPDGIARADAVQVDFAGGACNQRDGGGIGIDGHLPGHDVGVLDDPAQAGDDEGEQDNGNGNVLAKAGGHAFDDVADFFVAAGNGRFFFHDAEGKVSLDGYWL